VNELRFGGATYVATGRGLPTERRPFIGTVVENRIIPGGLYLDYARHTFYDGFNLLILMVLLGCAGGFQGTAGRMVAGILTSISLVTFSWLYAPYVFNPYQFRPQFFSADLRAWRKFFFDDRGQHWVEWYQKDQLKPRRGFVLTVLDPGFVMDFLMVIIWLSALNAKTAVVYHAVPHRHLWYFATLAPPVFSSFLFCCVVACIERLSSRSRMGRRVRAQEKQSYDRVHLSNNGSSSSASEASDNEAQDLESGNSCCKGSCPMMFVSLGCSLCILLDLRPLIWMAEATWRRALVAGLLYKYFWFRICIHFVRVFIRTKVFKQLGKYGRPFELWLWGTGMSRDVVVSSFIFWTLSPVILLSSCSQIVCPTWSFHHLLVYRQPGHSTRESIEAVQRSTGHSDEDSDYADHDDVDSTISADPDSEDDRFAQP